MPSAKARVCFGVAIWWAMLAIMHPTPFDTGWAQALLLLVPLVILPIGLQRVAADLPSRWLRVENALQLPTALLLGVAYLLPPGPMAAGLALPWLGTTGVIALCGLTLLLRSGRTMSEICLAAGLIFISVGGAWAVADRLGFRPLEFDPVIVLLTAIHFHYAGFTLPLVTGLAMRHVRGWLANLTGAAVIVGVPVVALGITTTHQGVGPGLECFAACTLALAGTLAALLHIRLVVQPGRPALVRGLWTLAALSLLFSMALAALYGSRFYLPVAWLDIPWMRALHGTANAIGFGLAAIVAWSLVKDTAELSPRMLADTTP